VALLVARATADIGMIPESFMGNDDEQRPKGALFCISLPGCE